MEIDALEHAALEPLPVSLAESVLSQEAASGEDGIGRAARGTAPSVLVNQPTERPMSQAFDASASRSLAALEQVNTLIAVIEMSQSKWLVAAVVPGIERQPLKKLDPDAEALLKLLQR